MYRRSVVLLSLDLFGKNTSGSGDETEESRRRVERSSTKLRVSLKSGKVRVICEVPTPDLSFIFSRQADEEGRTHP